MEMGLCNWAVGVVCPGAGVLDWEVLRGPFTSQVHHKGPSPCCHLCNGAVCGLTVRGSIVWEGHVRAQRRRSALSPERPLLRRGVIALPWSMCLEMWGCRGLPSSSACPGSFTNTPCMLGFIVFPQRALDCFLIFNFIFYQS